MFAVYNFLFVGFNILFAKRYAFVRSNTGVRALWKNIWKIKFSKYSQEWSCLEDLDIKNTFVQSEFNLDIHSVIYGFFLLQTSLHVADVIILSFLHACTCSSIFTWKQLYLLAEKRPTTCEALPSCDGGCPVAFSDIPLSAALAHMHGTDGERSPIFFLKVRSPICFSPLFPTEL